MLPLEQKETFYEVMDRLQAMLQRGQENQKVIKYELNMQKHHYLCMITKADILLSKLNINN